MAAPLPASPAPLLTGYSRRLLAIPRFPGLLWVGGSGLAIILSLTAFGIPLSGWDPNAIDPAARLLPPGSAHHLLGTDTVGRDEFARVCAGFRWSLAVGFLATGMAAVIGSVLGVIAGWNENWVRSALSRAMDTAIAFPYLVLATAIIAVTGHGFWALVAILGLVSWISFARIVYAETLSIRKREYILAARLLGISGFRLVRTYVLRGLRATLLVVATFVFADLLVAEASLSFLGVGAPLGSPTWGNMLAASREYLFTAPWLMYVPAAVVVLAVLTANLIGDGLSQLWGTPRGHD